MKPKPLDYVEINNEEEYDIAVKAFVKAGANYHKCWCEYKDKINSKAVVLFYAQDNDIVSLHKIGHSMNANEREITIDKLREYLINYYADKCKVGDIILTRQENELFEIEEISDDQRGFYSGLDWWSFHEVVSIYRKIE